jgi:3-hydroxyacyl-[acyl-carrier-protein] dehydratase
LFDLKLPTPAIDLIPHRNRMLLIDSLDEFGKDTGRAHLKISNKNLFIKNNGILDSIVYIELLAQLIAAHSGYESKLDNAAPKVGFLVGLKDLNIHQSVSACDMIDMQIKKDYEFDQITYVSGKIFHNNALIAEGTLKLWEQPANKFEPESPQIDNQPIKKYQLTDQSENNIFSEMELNKVIVQNIYELSLAEDQSSLDAQLYFSNDFVGFDGHFPGSPLLPGILMMKTGVLLSELALGKPLRVKKIKHAKFAKSIFPKQKVNLTIYFKNKDDMIQISATLSHQDEICAKYSLMTKVEQ